MTKKLQRKFELWLALHGYKVLPEEISCDKICKFASTCEKTEKERKLWNYKYQNKNEENEIVDINTCIRWLVDDK
jgi:hypothetical protein